MSAPRVVQYVSGAVGVGCLAALGIIVATLVGEPDSRLIALALSPLVLGFLIAAVFGWFAARDVRTGVR